MFSLVCHVTLFMVSVYFCHEEMFSFYVVTCINFYVMASGLYIICTKDFCTVISQKHSPIYS